MSLGLSDNRWIAVTPSNRPGEKAALEWLRSVLPDRNPLAAWSNFQFMTREGGIFEVDALVVAPGGIFLVEIKSYLGRLRVTPTKWVHDKPNGTRVTEDNPLFLANDKSKFLKELLVSSGQFRDFRNPFVEPIVFLSECELDIEFVGHGGNATFVRDDCANPTCGRWGIVQAMLEQQGPGLRSRYRVNKEMMKRVRRALADCTQPIQAQERLDGYRLGELIEAGPRFEDRLASKPDYPDQVRRARIYFAGADATATQRETLLRARDREFDLLSQLRHPAILGLIDRADHDRGPALLFEHQPGAERLDAWVTDPDAPPNADDRFGMLRTIGEAIQFAHQKHVVHRALSPRNILVLSAPGESPDVRIYNWMTAAGTRASSQGTRHVAAYYGETEQLYLAPELAHHPEPRVESDVYGLGALAAFIFTGDPPAESLTALYEHLDVNRGIRLSARYDHIQPRLDQLVVKATRVEVGARFASVGELLDELEQVSRTATIHTRDVDPIEARADDWLESRFQVAARLGKGGTAVALLAQDSTTDRQVVLKVATSEPHARRLLDEARALDRLSSPHIVRHHETVSLAERTTLVLDYAGDSLRRRLARQGSLTLDELGRFGSDLCRILVALEDAGVLHRDIKPENLGIGENRSDRRRQLVIFDFSLSGIGEDVLEIGTSRYRDPFLHEPARQRWDTAADRWSAALTLYEMSTGRLPDWSCGDSAPWLLPDACVRVEPEQLPAEVRHELAGFFERAFARKVGDRHHTAADMLRDWQAVFETTHHTEHADLDELKRRLASAGPETRLTALGLSESLLDALHRNELYVVGDLRTARGGRVAFDATGKSAALQSEVRRLVELVGQIELGADVTTVDEPTRDYSRTSVTGLVELLCGERSKKKRDERDEIKRLLGLSQELAGLPAHFPWPTTRLLAQHYGMDETRAHEAFAGYAHEWAQKTSLIPLRADVFRFVAERGEGILTDRELSTQIRHYRGTATRDQEMALIEAAAVCRAAVEAEQRTEAPTFVAPRFTGAVVIATPAHPLLQHLEALGRRAEALAGEEPLLAPRRAAAELRALLPPEIEITDDRLRRIAAAVSTTAYVSAVGELYPAGMPASRALRLAKISVTHDARFVGEDLQALVSARYPRAESLPTNRDALEPLITAAGLPLAFRASRGHEPDGWVFSDAELSDRLRSTRLLLDSTGTLHVGPRAVRDVRIHEHLQRSRRRGGFLAIMARHSQCERLAEQLSRHYRLELVDLDDMVIGALRGTADAKGIAWSVVMRADAAQAASRDGRNLRRMVALAKPTIAERLLSFGEPTLLTHPGLLARYGLMDVLAALRDRSGTADGPQTVWLVLPHQGSLEAPAVGGQTVHTIGADERLRIPSNWAPPDGEHPHAS